MREFVLVFVCTGNICRSPMAAGIMKDLVLDEVEQRHRVIPILISSAGTHAMTGSPASRHAVEVAAKYDINLNFHRSKPINESIARNADMILTMEKNHTDFIKTYWPFCTNVFELKNFARDSSNRPPNSDVPDPIGMDRDVYADVFDELRTEINRIAQRIFSMAEKKSGN